MKGKEEAITKAEPETDGLMVVARMLQSAIASGVSPDVLKLLCDHHERASAREAEARFNEALAAFQAACPAIPKTGRVMFPTSRGSESGYEYVELHKVRALTAPHLDAHGLSYRWFIRYGTPDLVVCEVRHHAGHVDSGSSFPILVGESKMMSRGQAYAAAQTFARRYALLNALGLVSEGKEDDDASGSPPITDAQLSTVMNLLDALPDEATQVLAKGALLDFTRVTRLEDIPSDLYDRVVAGLKKRIEAAAKVAKP